MPVATGGIVGPQCCPACDNDVFTVARKVVPPEACNVFRCSCCGLLRREILLTELSGRARLGREQRKDFEAIEERVAAARQRVWKDIFPYLESYRKTNKMLDIGSARGHFLLTAVQAGWVVEGIEPSLEDSSYAREKLGVRVRTGVFKQGIFERESYDVITMWNVLDHFLKPQEALTEANYLLRPGGILVLRLPNGSLHLVMHKVCHFLGQRDLSIFHNFGFSPKALRRILMATGFSRCHILNSVATVGDPYHLFGPVCGVAVDKIKRGAFLISQALYRASAGRILVAPSQMAFAWKN